MKAFFAAMPIHVHAVGHPVLSYAGAPAYSYMASIRPYYTDKGPLHGIPKALATWLLSMNGM